MYRTKGESTKANVCSVDETFFEKWSEDMAYVLGFFAADGCLTKNAKRQNYYVEFVSTDLEIIQKIKASMSADQMITERKHTNKKWKKAYRIQVGSKKIFEDLLNLGFTPKKSNSMRIPNIPENYFHDFLRGYFDGDGCISSATYKRKNRLSLSKFISIRFTSGSKAFLKELKEEINRLLESNKGCLCDKQKRGYELSFSTLDTIRIIKYMYQEKNCLCLDRKQKISARILMSRDEWPSSRI